MPITADQGFKAATPGTTRKNIEVGAGLSPGPTGVLVTIGPEVTDRELWNVETMVGHFTDCRDYMLNNLVSLVDAAAGTAIAVSCDAQGRLRPDGNNKFKLRVGADIATPEKSHVIDAMFKLLMTRLIEEAKTGQA